MTSRSPEPGPLMVDVASTELDPQDREVLQHPAVGGVVLFSRNYSDRQQLVELVQSIRQARSGTLLIGVDHEGGRVQRFRDGFTAIPAMRHLGRYYDREAQGAISLASECAWLYATELAQCHIDFSFAPVLDIDRGLCDAIGDRALHSDARVVASLAGAVIDGLHRAGFASVLKHFPGHGGVSIDSHESLPQDARAIADLYEDDMLPYRALLAEPRVAVMPGHVVYPDVDERPASLSSHWLQDILRKHMGFDGPIISDDLHMGAATEFAGPHDAAPQALAAGCDLVLVCNDRPAVLHLLETDALAIGDNGAVQRRRQMIATAADPIDHGQLQLMRAKLADFITNWC